MQKGGSYDPLFTVGTSLSLQLVDARLFYDFNIKPHVIPFLLEQVPMGSMDVTFGSFLGKTALLQAHFQPRT